MTSNKSLLSLDLSTNSTGYAFFYNGELKSFGAIKPDNRGLSKLQYPELQIKKIRTVVIQVIELIGTLKPDIILAEEVNLHKNRLGGKTLDMLHGVLLHEMHEADLVKVKFLDSDGNKGWRTRLGLKLSVEDKIKNKERKSLNKKISGKKIPIITKKHLAERWVNKKLDRIFNVDENPSDNDIVDAIALGFAFLEITC